MLPPGGDLVIDWVFVRSFRDFSVDNGAINYETNELIKV
jgi:hypothetical protein